jgi:DNA-binding NarL/FixJ family response regulator
MRYDRSVRVLLVEAHDQSREFVRSILNENLELDVVGEVSDGLEAVHKVKELKPEPILLDIGLPGLNGIEVARQVCKLVPKLKIVFLSQELSADVVQGALSAGALDYVVIAKAGSELLPVIGAAIRGKRFVSAGLAARISLSPVSKFSGSRPGNALTDLAGWAH